MICSRLPWSISTDSTGASSTSLPLAPLRPVKVQTGGANTAGSPPLLTRNAMRSAASITGSRPRLSRTASMCSGRSRSPSFGGNWRNARSET